MMKGCLPACKIKSKNRMFALTTAIQHRTVGSQGVSDTRKWKKRHPDWKRKYKIISICTWHDLNRANSKECTKRLLEITNKFIQAAGYKIDIPKSILCPYTCNEQSENKIGKTIPFAVVSKINYIGINVTKV